MVTVIITAIRVIINLLRQQCGVPPSYSTVNDTIDGETDDDVFLDAGCPRSPVGSS